MTEKRAREELATYGRLLWKRHLVSGTSGNLSLRLDAGRVLITPSARSLRALDPSEIVLVADDGTPHDAAQRPSSELPLHLAAYRVRPDIACVMHTHPTMAVVWSKTGGIFARDTVGASETLRDCAWTPYRKNGTAELAEICAAPFAAGIDVVMMERHGLSVIGATLEDAFMQTDLAEEASRIAYYGALLEQRS
ncbi:MAG TPA: class II aldolase/adducin family protein [Candidatus Aquilonibacter sp.]